ncbi:hypothetical protein CN993_27325 [Bacillus thuringiensis]|uniref:hypothetical protein n=1 Tax=Bacillus thuringiensis TaxID=1428 RepID=UPI000BFE4418|nr:hypothetical protein [Bacillus thuringiensis]PGP39299.1 hypothetical protein CN993_27325 [Bacillus thuringiensis]
MSSIGLEIRKLDEQLRATEGWRIRSKLEVFSISIYTFEKNNKELVNLLNQYETDSNLALEISSFNNTETFKAFLTEIIRLLHNYLASAMTLVDHTRKLFKDEYEKKEFEKEYNKKIDELFVQSPVSRFIQDLRNYSVHRMLPIAGASVAFSQETGMTHSIYLSKDKLIDWKGWKQNARVYLDKQEDCIKLLPLVNEYTKNVTEFQTWFQEKQNEIHSEAMKELEELEKKYSLKVAKIQNLFQDNDER